MHDRVRAENLKNELGKPESEPWPADDNIGLFTDLYELTMLQTYFAAGMDDEAVFSLFVRRLPKQRGFLLACGLESVLRYFENLHFSPQSLEYLRSTGRFSEDFLKRLADLRFEGDVFALPEGTPVFADEPILEVVAPIAQAQVAETFVMNQIHLSTVLATKAARLVEAAEGRLVVDFGSRRMHGIDSALKGARAFYIAGLDATSNVLAGNVYGVPIAGTMAHSFVQAFDHEADAFRVFVDEHPETILLVDTYDTLEGVRRVVDLAHQLGDDFKVTGIRLDSGDLGALAVAARKLLDEAGLDRLTIFASGGLDEHEIRRLVRSGAPIDGFGVGTALGVAEDAPSLDIAYKLCAYAGRGRLKLSTGKPILPGRKQVFRRMRDEMAAGDVTARADETLPGRPLLRHVMRNGRRLDPPEPLDRIRERARTEIAALPKLTRELALDEPGYPVDVSKELRAHQAEVEGWVAG